MTELRVGLTLAGGGAKGVYQVGVFKALDELGLLNNITAIAGASIGAINAVMLTGSTQDRWQEMWNGLKYEQLLTHDLSDQQEKVHIDISQKLVEFAAEVKKRQLQIHTLRDLLDKREIALFTQDGLIKLLTQYIDFEKVKQSRTKLWAASYNMEKEEPEYFLLSNLEHEDYLTVMKATTALPIIFTPVEYKGSHYSDGIPPHVARQNADTIPVKPLYDSECDLVIICYLRHNCTVDLSGFPESAHIIELYPSRSLEAIKGTGTFNISREVLAENQLLGYHDTLAAVAPYLLERQKGGSGELAIAAHERYNAKLLDMQTSLLRRADELISKIKHNE